MKPGTFLQRGAGCEQWARVRANVVGGIEVDLLGPHHSGGTMVIPHEDVAAHAWTVAPELPAAAAKELRMLEKSRKGTVRARRPL